ncbi:mutator family transposase [Streptomyces sp. 1114.5]|nr:mutator family transposase [Streptomyces sp. 1114.5]SOB81343.1 Transposase, Mutator family [Streptomyces sp. 1331.2]
MVVCDGLTGLPEAIETVWPPAITQTCGSAEPRLRGSSRPQAGNQGEQL